MYGAAIGPEEGGGGGPGGGELQMVPSCLYGSPPGYLGSLQIQLLLITPKWIISDRISQGFIKD